MKILKCLMKILQENTQGKGTHKHYAAERKAWVLIGTDPADLLEWLEHKYECEFCQRLKGSRKKSEYPASA